MVVSQSVLQGKDLSMKLKIVSMGIAAVLVGTAALASSASGAVKTERAEWYTGASPGTTLPVGTDEAINLELIEHNAEKKVTFTTTIAGQSLKLTATALSCSDCKITNKEVTEKAGAIAYGTGTVIFENVTVSEPAGCTVSSETGVAGKVNTKLLELHSDWMDTDTSTKKGFIQIRPDNGGTTFAQFSLAGGGCEAIAGAYNVTGSLFHESKNDTGVFATTHDCTFSAAVQATAGAGLKVGANVATLTGSVRSKLASGKSFAVKP
jgi:hypothetical protein